MSTLDDLATYIAGNSTFAVGANLFKNKTPPEGPDTVLALYETGGLTPQYTLSAVVSFEQPGVQLIARSSSYPTARTNAQTVWDLFSTTVNSTLGSTGNAYHIDITPQQSPFDIGTDDRARHLVSCNFLVRKAVS